MIEHRGRIVKEKNKGRKNNATEITYYLSTSIFGRFDRFGCWWWRADFNASLYDDGNANESCLWMQQASECIWNWICTSTICEE